MLFVLLAAVVMLTTSCGLNRLNRSTDSPQEDSINTILDFESSVRNKKDMIRLATIADSLCETDAITVAPKADLTTLQAHLDRLLVFNDSLQQVYTEPSTSSLSTAMQEFTFRSIVATQKRLKEAYENRHGQVGETARDPQTGMVYHFQQRVSEMLPYVQANRRYSAHKSRLLLSLLETLSKEKTMANRVRTWRAVERMVDEIDLAKSAYQYDVFTRSSAGITVAPEDVLARMDARLQDEQSDQVRAVAIPIVQSARSRLNSPPDKSFRREVESTRDWRRAFQEWRQTQNETRTSAGTDTMSWFQKARHASMPTRKIQYYTRALDQDPQNARIYHNRANAYESMGHLNRAVEDYSRALLLDSTASITYRNRAHVYQQLGQHESAIQDYDQAIRVDPLNAGSWLYRGISHLQLGNLDTALESLSRSQQLDSSQAAVWFNLGNLYSRMKDYDKAKHHFSRALDIQPDMAPAWLNRGHVYRTLGDDDQALSDFSRSIQLDSTFALAFDRRAILYRDQKAYQNAIQDHQRAIALDPDNASSYYNLGCVYWELEQWSETLKMWNRCLELDPDHRRAREWIGQAQKYARQH
jgi:tetratricopeptide (TPR) repeat protein